ncbi:MAG: lasso peptide biosynthesis B2 protein [Gemmatimonadota bacterium]
MIGRLARKARAAADVLQAAIAVRRARHSVARTPLGSLVQSNASPTPPADAPSLSPQAANLGRRWGVAVDRALRVVPGDRGCLVRASALRDLLAAGGLPRAEVRIGVRRGAAGFEAHAWVEQDGTPIAEPDTLRGAFASLDGVTLR